MEDGSYKYHVKAKKYVKAISSGKANIPFDMSIMNINELWITMGGLASTSTTHAKPKARDGSLCGSNTSSEGRQVLCQGQEVCQGQVVARPTSMALATSVW